MSASQLPAIRCSAAQSMSAAYGVASWSFRHFDPVEMTLTLLPVRLNDTLAQVQLFVSLVSRNLPYRSTDARIV